MYLSYTTHWLKNLYFLYGKFMRSGMLALVVSTANNVALREYKNSPQFGICRIFNYLKALFNNENTLLNKSLYY